MTTSIVKMTTSIVKMTTSSVASDKKIRQHDIFVAMFLPNADTRMVNSYPVFTGIVGLRVAMSHSTGRLLINHVLIGTEWCRAEKRDAFHYHA